VTLDLRLADKEPSNEERADRREEL
jgi:hypothetical protein